LGVAAEKYLGIGALFAELMLELGWPSEGAVVHEPSGISLALGYRFSVW
jgi:hypothetical protein